MCLKLYISYIWPLCMYTGQAWYPGYSPNSLSKQYKTIHCKKKKKTCNALKGIYFNTFFVRLLGTNFKEYLHVVRERENETFLFKAGGSGGVSRQVDSQKAWRLIQAGTAVKRQALQGRKENALGALIDGRDFICIWRTYMGLMRKIYWSNALRHQLWCMLGSVCRPAGVISNSRKGVHSKPLICIDWMWIVVTNQNFCVVFRSACCLLWCIMWMKK